jgi:hypothetical protein
MIPPGRRGIFTLVSDGSVGVVPMEINSKAVKTIRRIGGFLFDCEGFAKARADELNSDIHPGRFQPCGRFRVLTFPREGQVEEDE